MLAEAARDVLDAPVPTCREWTVRELLRHTGAVHQWAHAHVAGPLVRMMDPDQEAALFAAAPRDGDVAGWYLEQHARLLDALESAPPDLECWHFLAAPSPLAFWARRQTHETVIHRVDAELAAGRALSPVTTAMALDGIDELVAGFQTRRRSRLRTGRPRLLRLRATGAERPADWYVHLSPEPPQVRRNAAEEPDCTVQGPANALYLALWNRADLTRLRIDGDAALARLWQERSAI